MERAKEASFRHETHTRGQRLNLLTRASEIVRVAQTNLKNIAVKRHPALLAELPFQVLRIASNGASDAFISQSFGVMLVDEKSRGCD
jgi:hypothetical protein